MLSRAIYDSEIEANKYIIDLKTLHEIADARYNAGYNEGVRMREFKILYGFIWFDTCGNTMVKVGKDSYSSIRIPNEESICPICGKKWNIYNLEDYTSIYDYEKEKSTFYHKQCNFINNLNTEQKEFTDIFKKVYLADFSFTVIPNEYCQCDKCAPWFKVNTPDGDVKIGWRKRVISIKWFDNYKKFTDDFKDENVTKGFDDRRYIHAWSVEKCIEYLLRAKNSIV